MNERINVVLVRRSFFSTILEDIASKENKPLEQDKAAQGFHYPGINPTAIGFFCL
jgi:hypothetical protein